MVDGVELDISVSDDRWAPLINDAEAFCRPIIAAALAAAERVDAGPRGNVEVSVVLSNDAEVAALNSKFRDKAGPTNVLSFPLWSEDGGPIVPDAPVVLGDIVFAYDTIVAEAVAQEKTPDNHLRHLLVHGVLHLVGFDHIEENEAELMEAMETQILQGLGVLDPYAALPESNGLLGSTAHG